MTKSTQQLADEMARKAVMVHLPEHPANQLAMFNAIKESIPLLELLEVARAGIILRNRLAAHDGCSRYQIGDASVLHQYDTILTNLQKKFEL